MENHCHYLFDFTKKIFINVFSKINLCNEPCKYKYDLWVTYIRIKNGVYKIVWGGSSILNFFQWKCQIPIPPDLQRALYFLIWRPLLPHPPIQSMFYADKFGLYKLRSPKKQSNNTPQKTIRETWKFWLLWLCYLL